MPATMAKQGSADAEMRKNLELDRSRGARWAKRVATLLIGVGVVGGLIYWRSREAAADTTKFMTGEVARGDLRLTVTATGNLKGRDTVEVGAEVSGKILVVNVDYNDRVKKGQVLAEIDTKQLNANVEQAVAQVNSAYAQVNSAKATARETKLQAERARALAKQGLVSAQQLEAAEAAAARAVASVGSAVAQGTVARASLKAARTNLEKATVVSPIDGVVLARHVEAGQTVAAGFQTPILFTIARDLTEMLLSVDVDEADIGKVREGQPAEFTVDAYPERTFKAKLISVRNIPKTDQNVVTYEAVLSLRNDQLLLRPGMTATAVITTDEKSGVLLVPNAALRFTPPKEAKKGARGFRLFGRGRGGGRPPPTAAPSASGGPGKKQGAGRKRVWILAGSEPKAVRIKAGPTDGKVTEVTGGELKAGDRVIIDVEKIEEN